MNAVDYRIQVYKNGRDAVARIDKQATKNWYDWLTVGRSMIEARTEAFETVGTNKAIGAAYNQAFGDILRREKLHENVVDKGTRSLLLNIMDNELEIVAWRATLSKEQQRKWNHPSSIYRNWKLLTAPPQAPKPEREPLFVEDDPEGQNFSDKDEALQARDNQVKARDRKIEQLRESIQQLRSEIAWLRGMLGDVLEAQGHRVSKPPTNDEIKKALGLA